MKLEAERAALDAVIRVGGEAAGAAYVRARRPIIARGAMTHGLGRPSVRLRRYTKLTSAFITRTFEHVIG